MGFFVSDRRGKSNVTVPNSWCNPVRGFHRPWPIGRKEVIETGPVPTTNPIHDPTYPGLVNQDLINLFYKVASFFGENGWHWIVRAGLAAIGATRKTRFEDYRGPQIKSIPGLTQDQLELLESELNQLKYA